LHRLFTDKHESIDRSLFPL